MGLFYNTFLNNLFSLTLRLKNPNGNMYGVSILCRSVCCVSEPGCICFHVVVNHG